MIDLEFKLLVKLLIIDKSFISTVIIYRIYIYKQTQRILNFTANLTLQSHKIFD